jgi:hypothetical protein
MLVEAFVEAVGVATGPLAGVRAGTPPAALGERVVSTNP